VNFKEHKSISTILLLSAALIWGSTLALMKNSLGRIDVNSFLAWRFIFAALIMGVLRPTSFRYITPSFLLRGIGAGLLLGIGYILQTFGLTLTTVAKTGFITGLYAVFTPLIAAIFFKQHISKIQWLAVGLATVGMGVLSLRGLSIGLILRSAFYWIESLESQAGSLRPHDDPDGDRRRISAGCFTKKWVSNPARFGAMGSCDLLGRLG
jgi:drug/metabolite transporter (DMT)-like permease